MRRPFETENEENNEYKRYYKYVEENTKNYKLISARDTFNNSRMPQKTHYKESSDELDM